MNLAATSRDVDGHARAGQGRKWRRRLRRNGLGIACSSVMLLLLLIAAFAPLVAPYSPSEANLGQRLLPPLSGGHLLGTDALGRDLLSRLIFGARTSVIVALSTVLFAGAIGTFVGLLSGYFGGWIDNVVMRLIDVQLSFPFVILALTVAGILGPSLRNIIITLVITSWVYYARLVRGEALKLRAQMFIEAPIALGAKSSRVMARHIFPNLISVTATLASLEIGRIVISEAAISFLGFGVQPPTAAWGSMLNEGQAYIFTAWWLTVFPGIAICIVTLASNLFGDWLRDVLDPKSAR